MSKLHPQHDKVEDMDNTGGTFMELTNKAVKSKEGQNLYFKVRIQYQCDFFFFFCCTKSSYHSLGKTLPMINATLTKYTKYERK